MKNVLTIDVEDYFHSTALSGVVKRDDWSVYPSRVVDNTHRLMDILDRFDSRATFFVLGWVAERFPMLVREISDRGHEVACHGFGHQLVHEMDPEEFRNDVRFAKDTLEDIIGRSVLGYRAPNYSITPESMWALDILIDEGFKYDSSLYTYDYTDGGVPHVIKAGGGALIEFPPSAIKLALVKKPVLIPFAQGFWFRLLPSMFICNRLRHIHSVDNRVGMLALRSWDIDPGQPKIDVPAMQRLKQYYNIHFVELKLRRILSDVKFCTVARALCLNAA